METIVAILIYIQGGILGYFLGQLVLLKQFKKRLSQIEEDNQE
jgi:uncharacterized protein YneF (UPF0154 family)